jgi:outer membrane lipoprotein-sorting protein
MNESLRFGWPAWICIGILGQLISVVGYGDDLGEAVSSGWYDAISECYSMHAGIRGAFTHESISVHGKTGTTMTGTIEIAGSGKFRMSYSAPEQREIVFDGRKVRAFGPSPSEMYEYVGGEDDLFRLVMYLYGKSFDAIQEKFQIRVLRQSGSDKRGVVELKPRMRDLTTQKVVITTGSCPTAILRMIIVDRAGNLVRLTFRDVTPVDDFPKGAFRLRGPSNVPVIRP